MKKQNLSWTIWSGILGIVFFLILIGVLNIISDNISEPVFHTIVNFLNQNILLILLISIIILLANIFEMFIFPFNIFYPLFNAIGGVLWVEFIFRILILVSLIIETNLYLIFAPFYLLALIIVPIVILIVGYVNVFVRLVPRRRMKRMDRRQKIVKIKQIEKGGVEWKNVGYELKDAAYNLTNTIKTGLEPKKVKKKVKKITKKVKKDVKKTVKEIKKKRRK